MVPQSTMLAAVIAVTIPTHMAAAGLCVGLMVTLALVPRFALGLPRPKLLLAAVAVAAGILLCPLSNLAITGRLAFTPGGESFLFGRLIEDGTHAELLAAGARYARLFALQAEGYR